jgi:integrase
VAKQVERLTIAKLKALVRDHNGKAARHLDGDGLYFQLTPKGAASWLLRYKCGERTASGGDRERYMGLGPWPRVSLPQARDKARAALDGLRSEGVDPLLQRREDKAARLREREAGERRMTFKQAAEGFYKAKAHEWKNAKHSAQFLSTLEAYAYPFIGELPVAEIEIEDVLRVLEPIWHDKTETASRVRGRMEVVFGYAIATRHRTAGNPARWKGQLERVLASPTKLRRAKSHAALPYRDLPDFITALRERQAMAARALEFLVLCAARTSEVTGATWGEIDLTEKVWTVPAERMKAGKEHRVPLSEPALALLKPLGPGAKADPIFPSAGRRPMSNMAMATLLKRMGRDDITVHGFRSTFRDWAGDETTFPRELAESALAHSLGKTERAYRRSDALERRRALMQTWANWCDGQKPKAGNVTPIKQAS